MKNNKTSRLETIYLVWYYGYQNFGDEFLLLWVLNYLTKIYPHAIIYIEAHDMDWLSQRLMVSQWYFDWYSQCRVVSKFYVKASLYKHSCDLFVLWGWEVLSDARAFPWNGWSYIWKHRRIFLLWKPYILLGGIGTIKKWGTSFLYKVLLSGASKILVRDVESFSLAKQFTDAVEQYHDFAYDVFDHIQLLPKKKNTWPWYLIFNVNIYLWNDEVKETLQACVKNYPHSTYYFFPAAWWSDDVLFEEIKALVPDIQMFDRRNHWLEDIISFFSHASYVCAARLHVLLLAKKLKIPFTPLVYQEKVKKLILDQN